MTIICIAHNTKAFDAQFILCYITEKRVDLDPRVILNGTKIVVLTAGRMKFSDSINYMPMRLSAVPKIFGLRGGVEKGYFPHLFNILANQSYVGPLPAVEYYSPDNQMRENAVFDFQHEIVRYCRNDVDILRGACMAFRKIFLERGSVCPFEECTTIASTCMRVFCKNFLREEEIGVIPRSKYLLADTQSRKALQWLVWKERELGRIIVYAGHGREHRLAEVGGIPVDGYYKTANDHHPMLAAEPLSPRDAFFGGRTENIAVRREVTGTEKIPYVDVCSLYLYVLKTDAFPNRHPKILVGQKECALLIGAMPGVDFSAVEELTQCSHENSRDREFEGVWVSCELRKAVEKSYLVTAQEASGWPSKCVDDQSKERYFREYEAVEGIALDRTNIAQNPKLRSVAKLCLNSFWEKFGQQLNLTSTEVAKSQERLLSLLSNPEHEVINILSVNDEVIYVSWRMRDKAVVPSPITNVIIAVYTTAQARLRLYEYLERLGERVLYYDTNSCNYVSSGKLGKYEPRTENFLGDMTDVLESYARGSYIESFVSGGPKFYAAIRLTAFHEVVTRDESKICSPVLLKRRFIDERRSVPYSYLE
ncbi:uncharacterized protein LOC109862333 [Pseudomyrmex gracilis]|uniref:uncharacterized protein LOC109862333 n=1 Tax=Pseudomyrmex gracilis TaxID=219809 RepID=UPI000994E533|nr:uncharacterized protein LOC109862333 [Pseudomyrmex gracilis]